MVSTRFVLALALFAPGASAFAPSSNHWAVSRSRPVARAEAGPEIASLTAREIKAELVALGASTVSSALDYVKALMI